MGRLYVYKLVFALFKPAYWRDHNFAKAAISQLAGHIPNLYYECIMMMIAAEKRQL